MACYEARVPDSVEGMRLDGFIRRFLPEVDAVQLREAFRRRDVKRNGKRVRSDERLMAGDLVQVYAMEAAAPVLDVVYEDADVLLLNKRAGISVEDDGGGVSLSALALRHVRAAAPDALAPLPCHRLDNQTCGLILFAKNTKAAEVLEDVFRARSLDKRYICLVKGQPKPPSAQCRAWLRKDTEAGRVTVLDHPARDARPIITAYETLQGGEISRLRVHLITGRTHQIRAHMAALGHPLLGDDVYGDRAFNRLHRAQGKLMLCAASLCLDTGGRLPQLDGHVFTIDCPF